MQPIPLIFWPFLALTLSFSLILFILPSITQISIAKNFDYPDDGHFEGLPQLTMGGVALFIAIVLASIFASAPFLFSGLNMLIAAMIVLFFTGFVSDCQLRYRALRIFSKIIAAIMLVLPGSIGKNILPTLFPVWTNKIILIILVLGFMFLYHLFTQKRMRYYFLSGLIGSLFFGVFFIQKGIFSYAVVALALTGGILGAFVYAEYCLRKKLPVPRLGHTGIYMTSIILASLFLQLIEMH